MKKEIKIKIPSVPNFLLLDIGYATSIPISDFTEEQLREVGKEWTNELIIKSRRK